MEVKRCSECNNCDKSYGKYVKCKLDNSLHGQNTATECKFFKKRMSEIDRYREAWISLKTYIDEKKAFHDMGIMQSIDESLNGSANCKDILDQMSKIEKEYSINESKSM